MSFNEKVQEEGEGQGQDLAEQGKKRPAGRRLYTNGCLILVSGSQALRTDQGPAGLDRWIRGCGAGAQAGAQAGRRAGGRESCVGEGNSSALLQ